MMLAIEVTVVPDDDRAPTTTNTARITLDLNTAVEVVKGKLPFRYQIFAEAAVPQLIRDTIKEALEVPTRVSGN